MRVFLGCLWSSIKQIKDTYVFDWEHRIALHTMKQNWASSHGEGKSHGFSRNAVGTWVIFSSYGEDDPSKLVFVQ